ncbi:MAG: ABC transporter ATP-binding protein [Planctomycetota bacterium]|jgi:ABC-2 type transport system ATP-binding protein|nr:ABC transporter ATP-binding protein [Planctomycetota bacterium]MDA1025469.1 ABC transporter ATP-binding protein [Planctomycetota bacterium]
MIQAKGITKRYGRFTAVKDLDLEVPDGMVCGLLGPNGAGKTTTMRMITGMLPPDEGSLRVAGHAMPQERRAALSRLGYLPESAPSYPEMRVIEFLRFKGRLLGLDRATIDRTAGVALEACDLAEVSRRLIGQLSKGFRQRVGLAASLMGDPSLLVLDEPTVGLDPRQLRDFRRLIRRLAETRTVLLSSHIMQEIEAVADHIVILNGGRKLAEGSIDELRSGVNGRSSIRIAAPADDALKSRLAAAVDGIAEVHVPAEVAANGDLRFEFDGPDRGQMIGAAISAAGGSIIELRHDAPGLETVFLQLLDREAGDHGGAA